jgi:hypothetical protein
LISRKDASLHRLNGIIYNVKKLDRSQGKIETVRLVESLSNLRLNPLFLKVDPVAQPRITQAEVVNLFISRRASISPTSVTRIVNEVPDHDYVYLIEQTLREKEKRLRPANIEPAFYLLWNIHRYSQPKAMRIADSVAGQLQSHSTDDSILTRLAISGLLHRCNVVTKHPRLLRRDLEKLKQMLTQRIAQMSLTMPLLSLVALKAKRGKEQFREIKAIIDWDLVNETVRGSKDPNLRAVFSELLKALGDCSA